MIAPWSMTGLTLDTGKSQIVVPHAETSIQAGTHDMT